MKKIITIILKYVSFKPYLFILILQNKHFLKN